MRTRRMTFWTILVLLLMMLTIVSAPAVAPPPEKPEKLRIDEVSYNSDTQSFEVDLSASYGIATAGERANFQVSAELEISQPDRTEIYVIGPEYIPVWIQGPSSPQDHMVPLAKIHVPWDRNGGSVQGPVEVKVTAKIGKLTTTRSNVFAVWVTVGFFEVDLNE